MDVFVDRRPMHLQAPEGSALWWADDWWQKSRDGWELLDTNGSPEGWSGPVDVGPELAAGGAAGLRGAGHKPFVASTARGPVLFTTEGHGTTVARILAQVNGKAATLGAAPTGLPAPPVTLRFLPQPYGSKGVEFSTQKVHDGILEDRLSRIVIEWTRQILADADIGARGWPDADKITQAIFRAQKRVIKFLEDPRGSEFIPPASAMLCKDPRGLCLKAEDCDGQIRFLGACLSSVGISLRLRVRYYEGENEAHITLMYEARQWGTDKRAWHCIDPSTETGRCYDGPYKKEWTMDIQPASGTFVSLGAPPQLHKMEDRPRTHRILEGETLGTPGTLGAPGDPPIVSEAQNAAWFGQLADCQADVNRAHTRLTTNANAFAAVRADLGLPVTDPDPGGLENASSDPPLVSYLKTGAWTDAAKNQEQKLLQSLGFLSTCLGEAIAGARQVYWNSADLWIENKPGDPYYVLMRPNAAGKLVPQYVDPASNQPTGTLGLAPAVIIALAAIGAVTTMATCYAVVKTAEYLSGAHHDDATAKINEAIQSNIASGKATPEQEVKILAAQKEMHAAQPPSLGSKLADLFDSVPMMILLVLAGLAGGYAVARYAPPLFGEKKKALPAKTADAA